MPRAKNKLQDLGEDTYDSSLHAEASIVDSVFRIYNVVDDEAFEKASAKSSKICATPRMLGHIPCWAPCFSRYLYGILSGTFRTCIFLIIPFQFYWR